MKHVLYIFLSLLLLIIVSDSSFNVDEYTRIKLLPSTHTYTSTASDSFGAYVFKTKSDNSYPLSSVLEENKLLTSNFVISTKFKVNDITNSWWLFAIQNKDNKPLLQIGFEHVGLTLTRITLYRSFLDKSKLKHHMNGITINSNFTNKWTTLAINVSGYDVTFEVNCNEQYDAANDEDKILSNYPIQLTGDMKLILARSNCDFEVVIEQLFLYPLSNEQTLDMICNRGRSISDILKSDKEDAGVHQESAGLPGLRGPQGTPGVKGEKGPPGLSVEGQKEAKDEYTRIKLLPSTHTYTSTASDNFGAYVFKTISDNSYPLSSVLEENKLLTSNFVISTKFKVNDITNRWSLFAILNKDNRPLLQIGFEHVGLNLTRITLYRSFLDKSKLKYHMNRITIVSNFTNKWTTLAIYVSGYDVTFEVNCNEQYEAANDEDKILSNYPIQLTGDMTLILARSKNDFEVVIEQLFLYPLSNKQTLDMICNRGRSISDILKSDKEDAGVHQESAGLPGGAQGTTRVKWEIGPPGLSVEGQKGAKEDSYVKDFGDFTLNWHDEDAFLPVNTFVFTTLKGLMKKNPHLSVGTLVYVLRESLLLIKVDYSGRWNRVEMHSWSNANTTLRPSNRENMSIQL